MDELLCQTNISANHGNPVKLDKRTRLLLLFKITRVLVLTKPQYTLHILDTIYWLLWDSAPLHPARVFEGNRVYCSR